MGIRNAGLEYGWMEESMLVRLNCLFLQKGVS